MADQAAVEAWLADPATHGLAGDTVARIDTHAAIVFLAGDRAYKLKRAIRLPYLDYSTVARRRAAAEAEVRLNRRTAPDLYLGARPVVRGADGRLSMGGEGTVIDWLVEMRRFDQAGLLDRLATAGGLTREHVVRLGDEIAAFHESAAPRADDFGPDEVARLIGVNDDCLRAHATALFDPALIGRVKAASEAALARLAPAIEARRREGRVRDGHGDLHLRNIVLLDGRPTLFDAIEFDPRLSRIDVMYDLAFLLMDLWHRDLRAEANLLLNRYLLRTGDLGGLRPLPLFLSLRAGIRAHVSATMAAGRDDPEKAAALRGEAVAYLALAADCLHPRRAGLVGVGGLSGSGKSSLASRLAPALGAPPGAVVVRSDELRKRLFGVPPETRLGPDAYTEELNAKVYDALRRVAGAALAAGAVAVADAVHDRADSRAQLAAVAERAGAPFAGLWLAAPAEVMAERIGARRGDASDATVAVLDAQLKRDPGPIDWTTLDARRPIEALADEARALLERCGMG